jgi:hypothetical protein
MRRVALWSSLGWFLALCGCSVTGECRNAGPQGSLAYQTCVSTILQRENQLQNQRDRMDWRGSDG